MNEGMEDAMEPSHAGMTGAAVAQEEMAESQIRREVGKLDPARAQAVKQWVDRVNKSKDHWKDTFEQMRKNQKFVRGNQWPAGVAGGNSLEDTGEYVANIVMRHINQRTAQLYAKHPTVVAKRKPRMDFEIWDGDQQAVQAAMMAVAGAMQGDPMALQAAEQAQMLLADVEQGSARRKLVEKVGRTLEILMNHSFDDPTMRFKKQFKQLIRRVDTCKVGYIKVGYQRQFEQDANVTGQIADATRQIDRLQTIASDLADGEIFKEQAELDRMKESLRLLQGKETILVREGLTYSFPRSTAIIPDMNCSQLAGFIGADWVAEEYVMTPDEIKDIFKVDVGASCAKYTKTGNHGSQTKKADETRNYCLVYEIYDIILRTRMWVCEGYDDYLEAPDCGDVDLAQFHPYFALTFNDLEDEEMPYPVAEVELLKPMQLEYNRSREGLRQHRIANRPAVVGANGALNESDVHKLADHATMEYIQLNLPTGAKASDIMMPKPTVPIDPAVYDVEPLFQDLQRVSASQPADLGGVSGATATESTISEQARSTTMGSAVDDIDEFLTDVVKASGEVLLKEMSIQTVKRIAGPGAVWPELTRLDYVDELFLDIRAGSSGRPNSAIRAANIERMMPYAIQLPDVNPKYLRDRLFQELDEDYDPEEAALEGMPSIQALNGMMTGAGKAPPQTQTASGKPNAPQAQGAQGQQGGANNAPAPPANDGQGQGQQMNVQQPGMPA